MYREDIVLQLEQIWVEYITLSSSLAKTKSQKRNPILLATTPDDEKLKMLQLQLSQKAFYEIESTRLNIFGDLDIHQDKLITNVDGICFQYISIDKIIAGFVGKMKKCHNLSHLTLRYNNITRLEEVNRIKQLTQITSLIIDNNPVNSYVHILRPFIISHFTSLTSFNQMKIEDEEKNNTEQFFGMYCTYQFCEVSPSQLIRAKKCSAEKAEKGSTIFFKDR